MGTAKSGVKLRITAGNEVVETTPEELAAATEAMETRRKPNIRAGSVAVDQLKSIIARVEKLEEEKAAIGSDIKDVFAEAKGNGFDVKAIRTIIKIRKMDAQEREEEETILGTYMNALGMLPLFEDHDTETMLQNHKVVDIAKKIWEVLIVIAYEKAGVWVTQTALDALLAEKLEGLGYLKKSAAASDTWVLTDEVKVEALKAKAAA